MWMSYRNYTEIIDLKIGVQHLSEQFFDMAIDADHQAVYGNGYMCEEECLFQAKIYREGNNLCEKYLKLEIDFKQLYESLKQIGLVHFLNILKPYVSLGDEEEEEENEGMEDAGYDTVN